MKKMCIILCLFLSFMLAGVSFGGNNGNNSGGNSEASASAEANSLNFNANTNLNVDTNLNINRVVQGQLGIVAPVQEIIIESPKAGVGVGSVLPGQSTFSELNFAGGKIIDITKTMPNLALYGIEKYNGEAILSVMKSSANVKFKNYISEVIEASRELSAGKDFSSRKYRVIVYAADAYKTWQFGASVGTGGAAPVGSGGLSGGGSLGPQWGGTKADLLITYFFVEVSTR